MCRVLEASASGYYVWRSRPESAQSAVVLAHDSHIGDARPTDMGESRDGFNFGQLARENYDEEACLIGFGVHSGTVAAADDWDAPMKIKRINPSRADSYGRLAHDSGVERFLLDLREGVHDRLRDVREITREPSPLLQNQRPPRLHRGTGGGDMGRASGRE